MVASIVLAGLFKDHVINFSTVVKLMFKLSCCMLLANRYLELPRCNVDGELGEVIPVFLAAVLTHFLFGYRHNLICI